jgi:hypothetical protein
LQSPQSHKQNHTKRHNALLPNPKLKTQVYDEKHKFIQLPFRRANQPARAL